jgi:hypothetical protein
MPAVAERMGNHLMAIKVTPAAAAMPALVDREEVDGLQVWMPRIQVYFHMEDMVVQLSHKTAYKE